MPTNARPDKSTYDNGLLGYEVKCLKIEMKGAPMLLLLAIEKLQ
jgi:hypothetical protein